ncbi:hypothetical protein AB0D94_22390 [Streptomyces sp. NPDC048255]|uniref:hypothetical protein n=1 Tax=Streptomyces sp. NPDC048255 TaxID=3154713 RepID=UPI0033FEE065
MTRMRCSPNEHVERELTALDVAGVISAVAGVTPLVIALRRAWAKTLRGRVGREGSLRPQAEPALGKACDCGQFVILRYEPPDGGRMTVWTMPAAALLFDTSEQGRGPW